MITKLVSFLKIFLFNEKIALLNELLFIKLVFFLLGPEIETFWSILIIKQYFAECVFVLAPWVQVPVLINDLLNHSYQTIHSKRLIQYKLNK